MRWGNLFSSIIGGMFADAVHREHAAHANRKKPGDPPPPAVRFGWLSWIVGLLACAIVLPIAAYLVLSLFTGRPVENNWFAAPFVSALAVVFVIASYDSFVRRIEWTETEVWFRKWNSSRVVPWSDIVGLEEKTSPTYLRIAFRDGSGFAITETMRGSHYFLNILERHLGPRPPESKRRKRRQRGKKG